MKQKSLVILFALCVMLSSCFEDQRTYMETQLPPVEQTDTSDKEKGITDSLKTDTTKAVAKDTEKVEAVIAAKAVTKESRLPNIWEILVLAISGLALVFCLFILRRIRRLGKDVSHELREAKHDSYESLNIYKKEMSDKCKKIEGKIEGNCSDMKKDIERLSEQIRRLESNEVSLNNCCHENKNELEKPKEDKKQPIKRGYFGIVKVGGGIAMFNDYPKSCNEGAYFEVEYSDDNHCEFAPIDLDKIRSIDAVSEAVEYNGDMAYAKSMKVIKKGKAVFDKGHDFWKITDKADIKLKN